MPILFCHVVSKYSKCLGQSDADTHRQIRSLFNALPDSLVIIGMIESFESRKIRKALVYRIDFLLGAEHELLTSISAMARCDMFLSLQYDDFKAFLIQEFEQIAVGIAVKTRAC